MSALIIGALAALAFVLAPKPGPTDEVVVLPGPTGRVGMVVVQRGDRRHVLDRAYAASRSGNPDVEIRSSEEIRTSFGATLAAMPARPASFLLYFVFGTDELTGESKGELEKVLAELKRRPVPDIAVIGHTDTIGEHEANDALSAQRAERVKRFLVEVGIAAERIQISGRGKREPVVLTTDNIDEPRNRRVEINVR
jgi:outer membrane protein OmpA-like peptidoglycan-associated protein